MPRRIRHFNFVDEAFFYDAGDCRSFNGGNLTDIGKDSLGYNATNVGCTLELDSTINDNKVIRYDALSDRIFTPTFSFSSADRYTVYLTVRTVASLAQTQTLYSDSDDLSATFNIPKLWIYRPSNSNNLVVRYGRPSAANVDVTYTNFFANVSTRYINIIFWFFKSTNTFVLFKNGTRLGDVVIQSDALFPTRNVSKGIGNWYAGGSNSYSVMLSAVGVGNNPQGNIFSTALFQYRFRDLDPDAAIFFTATGITDTNIQYAINELVKDLKQLGLWQAISAIYPFVGGTAASHAVNLKQSGIFGTITWVGGVTHNSNGVTFNGTTGYGNVNFAPNNANLIVNTTNQTMGLYSRTSGAFTAWDMGSNTGLATAQALLQIRSATDGDLSRMFGSGQVTNATITDGSGLHLISRFGNDLRRIQNGIVLNTNSNTSTGTVPNVNYFIGCRNNNGTPANYSNRNISLAIFAYNISTVRANENLYKIIQKFQTLLGRQVGTPIY